MVQESASTSRPLTVTRHNRRRYWSWPLQCKTPPTINAASRWRAFSAKALSFTGRACIASQARRQGPLLQPDECDQFRTAWNRRLSQPARKQERRLQAKLATNPTMDKIRNKMKAIFVSNLVGVGSRSSKSISMACLPFKFIERHRSGAHPPSFLCQLQRLQHRFCSRPPHRLQSPR